MRLEWIEDILAVVETGSMIRAAERRCLTQSAFSRRLRTIEDHLGARLFDRTRKPAELKPAVIGLCDEMRDLAAGLRKLQSDLAQDPAQGQSRIVIASQHAITTAIAPLLIEGMGNRQEVTIRLRSANRDDCYALMLTRQADLMLFYSTERQPLVMEQGFVEHVTLGQEKLIPVFSAEAHQRLRAAVDRREVPVAAYPDDVFLGQVVRKEIWSRLESFTFRAQAETALTLAALQFALMGAAVAWVPRSLALPHLQSGALADFSEELGAQELLLNMARLNGGQSAVKQASWAALLAKGRTLLPDPDACAP